MNKLFYVSLFISSLLLLGCSKDVERVTIQRDCSGTYAEFKNGTKHLICNEQIVETITDGTKIRIKFETMTQCFGLVECDLYYKKDGYIEITEVK